MQLQLLECHETAEMSYGKLLKICKNKIRKSVGRRRHEWRVAVGEGEWGGAQQLQREHVKRN